MLALVDESIRLPTPSNHGLYVVGCVIVPQPEIDALRAEVTKLGNFHFRKASTGRQEAMLRSIGGWRLLVAGYSRRGWPIGGKEEARQACMKRMLLDLRDWEITEIVFEQRTPPQDTRDSLSISGAARLGGGPKGVTAHWRGKEEPLLRLPDAVAGAVRTAAGNPARHDAVLKEIGAVRRKVR